MKDRINETRNKRLAIKGMTDHEYATIVQAERVAIESAELYARLVGLASRRANAKQRKAAK